MVAGYGFGGFLVAVGLVLALAVNDATVGPLEVMTVGWILVAVGAALILLAAVTNVNAGKARSQTTTVHPDGSQTVRETRTDVQ